MTGIVYIVGAGPGDPGLITVRGRACLRDSDVVVYDNLAPRELLDEARPDAELIYAGKRAADHALRQSEINEILIDRARGGKIVCRLKGGDPFLFGRGGEETTHLAAARVPFVVVPGVSAAIAVPAYAGIPVTHRAYSVTLCVSTGHEDPAKEASDLDWSLLAGPMRTLVFFMGVRTLPHIRERLIAHGMPDSTPVALIERGTTPWQRTAVGTLADIAQIAEERRFAPPCLVVVGEVVRLRDEMVWYEKRPLFGVTVMNTRATHQAADLSRRLADLGARVVEVPLIAIAEPADREPLLEAARALDTFDWIVLTSTNAVDALWNAVREIGRDARAFGKAGVAAVGGATAARLAGRGIVADLLPPEYVAESLAGELLACVGHSDRAARVLIPHGDRARSTIADALLARGVEVIAPVAYRTVPAGIDARRRERLLADMPDVVTFASSSTASAFVDAFGEEGAAKIAEHAKLVSIGPQTTRTMEALDLPVAAEADPHDIGGMIDAILRAFAAR